MQNRCISLGLNRFAIQLLNEIEEKIYPSCRHVKNINKWESRYKQLKSSISLDCRQLEQHIFELKAINFINKLRGNFEITYEPAGKGITQKNCDLLISIPKGRGILVELKSFFPQAQNKKIPHQYISKNTHIDMDCESYHLYQAPRGQLIDATFETEEKMSNYNTQYIRTLAVLTGFYLHPESLRKHVAIYCNGKPKDEDPLGNMALFKLNNDNKKFNHCIDEFWSLPFEQYSFNFITEKDPLIISPRIKYDRKIRISQCHAPWCQAPTVIN